MRARHRERIAAAGKPGGDVSPSSRRPRGGPWRAARSWQGLAWARRQPAAPGVAAVVCASLVAATAHAAAPAFSDQTAAAGLAFAPLQPVDHPAAFMSGGATVGDFDGDGWPDLFVVGGGLKRDRLLLNQRDGTFASRGLEWGLADLHRGTGAIAADYDADGRVDVYVTSMGALPAPPANGQHRLYRNVGGRFVDVAARAGVHRTKGDGADGYGAAFGDYDLDGDLDLFVCGWHDDGVRSTGNRLFRSAGDGTFTDVTVAAGVFDAELRGFTPRFVDTDGDRFPELLVTGDFSTSRYFANDGAGAFTRTSILAPGAEKVANAMGAAIADFDRDGRLDWFVDGAYTAWLGAGPPGNRLYRNLGGHRFRALPEAAGVHDAGWAWGAVARDFNHDGWVDLAVTNGWQNEDPVTGESFAGEPTYLFMNTGRGFVERAQAARLDHRGQGRALVELDYDRDGDMDLVVVAHQDALTLFRNDSVHGPGAAWLQVELDTSANAGLAPHGLGTRIELVAGGRRQVDALDGGPGYLGGGELVVHFGLGAAMVVDELRVDWPDGVRTTFTEVGVDQRLRVRRGPGGVAVAETVFGRAGR